MQIKHKKYQNTGILFELLVRTITSDVLAGQESKALPIIKKFFTKTELGKEYKLYEIIGKNSKISDGKAEMLINTITESSKNLNRSLLRQQKYNLIKEIKDNYDLDQFFKNKLPIYKTYASVYTLLEAINSKDSDPKQVVANKINILEHLTVIPSSETDDKELLYEEFKTYDKSTRILAYKIMLDKFNSKYDDLRPSQKIILKEFIYNADNSSKLRQFYDEKSLEIKNNLSLLDKKIKNKPIKIKLNEAISLLEPHPKMHKIDNDDLINLLQFCDLYEEIKLAINE